MTLSLRARCESLLKHFTPEHIADTIARIQEEKADECGRFGKRCKCHGGMKEVAYCASSRHYHEARCYRQCAGGIRGFDLDRPEGRSER
jgi:hypothetical protein